MKFKRETIIKPDTQVFVTEEVQVFYRRTWCRLSMAAYDILRRNKKSIEETLCADYKLILNKAEQNKLITKSEYNHLKLSRNKYKVMHVSIVMLVDMIMDKGMENCQLFLDLLQTDEAIQKTFPKLKNILKNILEDGQYELKSQPTGLCLIINNKTFVDGNVRRGTDKDAERLGEVFSWLGFRVLMCTDQTKDQMERVLTCFASQRGLSQLQEFKVQEWTGSRFTDLLDVPLHGDAFICCLLSHGDKGVVSGVDGEHLRIKKITRTFMATPQSPLSAKPKVFLIQACQGGLVHPTVESIRPLNSDSTLQVAGSQSTSIPQEADFLVHSSTVQDCYANRDPMKGSVFIQSVCNQLEEGCHRKEEIEVILRRVNKEVAAKERVLIHGPVKQMPKMWHTLRKRLVLTHHRN
ncbi:hypothetical protein CgunFtcFv8_009974 [Champsocephalus gunnari]|uniref:Caspase-8 n=1 Tax=Champsocephalus gunnari TaxID=52237 RepID=A0AAN8C306_CHAGU|nr:hypothetical protein CgunFtcFv8_009974 [Champsocephalus gunnari]